MEHLLSNEQYLRVQPTETTKNVSDEIKAIITNTGG